MFYITRILLNLIQYKFILFPNFRFVKKLVMLKFVSFLYALVFGSVKIALVGEVSTVSMFSLCAIVYKQLSHIYCMLEWLLL